MSTLNDETVAKNLEGRIKWQNAKHGYGMIERDGESEDVFFHRSELKIEGYPYLPPGIKVTFDLVHRADQKSNHNGLRAKNVQMVLS